MGATASFLVLFYKSFLMSYLYLLPLASSYYLFKLVPSMYLS